MKRNEVKSDKKAPRVRTGVKAGDVYMQFPRGSNN